MHQISVGSCQNENVYKKNRKTLFILEFIWKNWRKKPSKNVNDRYQWYLFRNFSTHQIPVGMININSIQQTRSSGSTGIRSNFSIRTIKLVDRMSNSIIIFAFHESIKMKQVGNVREMRLPDFASCLTSFCQLLIRYLSNGGAELSKLGSKYIPTY